MTLGWEEPCIAYQDSLCLSGGHMASHLWFSKWFLDAGYFEAPGVYWRIDGTKVTMDRKDGALQRIWVLTDQYDEHGGRLGIWPD